MHPLYVTFEAKCIRLHSYPRTGCQLHPYTYATLCISGKIHCTAFKKNNNVASVCSIPSAFNDECSTQSNASNNECITSNNVVLCIRNALVCNTLNMQQPQTMQSIKDTLLCRQSRMHAPKNAKKYILIWVTPECIEETICVVKEML